MLLIHMSNPTLPQLVESPRQKENLLAACMATMKQPFAKQTKAILPMTWGIYGTPLVDLYTWISGFYNVLLVPVPEIEDAICIDLKYNAKLASKGLRSPDASTNNMTVY
jgi:hypothetical protein